MLSVEDTTKILNNIDFNSCRILKAFTTGLKNLAVFHRCAASYTDCTAIVLLNTRGSLKGR